MKNPSPSNQPPHITRGDIFDDLGFSPGETLEAKIKADIWQALMRHIERHEFTQAYLVSILKVHQPDVSHLLNGKISRFSMAKLIQFAGRLNLNAQLTITAPEANKPVSRPRAATPKRPRTAKVLAAS